MYMYIYAYVYVYVYIYNSRTNITAQVSIHIKTIIDFS